MFSFLKKLFKKIIKTMLKYWFIILILVIIFAPILAPMLTTLAASLPAWIAWLPTAIAALGSYGWIASLVVGLGLAYIVFPEETIEVIESVVSKVGSFAGDVIGAVASGLGLTKWLGIGAAVFVGYLILTSDDEDEGIVPQAERFLDENDDDFLNGENNYAIDG